MIIIPKNSASHPVATRPLNIKKTALGTTLPLALLRRVPPSQVCSGLGGGLDKPKGFAPQGRAANGVAASQPIQWSSEFTDTDLALVYYNYRHYNPLDGRWTGRDLAPSNNKYCYVRNQVLTFVDVYGNFPTLMAAAPAAVGAGALLPALGITVAVIAVGAAAVYIWQQASEAYDDSVEDTEADESTECRKNRREEECMTQCRVRYHACLERGTSAKTNYDITPAIERRCKGQRNKCELKCYQGKWPQE